MAKFSKNAITVLKKRYNGKDKDGNPTETPDEMIDRVAKHIAMQETESFKWYKKFHGIMDDLKFLPNSPTLMNAGRELNQLSACFVLPVEDTMEGIFDAVKWGALVNKSGGGTGYSFSSLRAKNSSVGTTGGVACLTGDTILFKDKPSNSISDNIITINDIWNQRNRLNSQPIKLRCLNEETGKFYRNECINIFDNGIVDVYEIKTNLGYTIKSTMNHRFLNELSQWQELDMFHLGDMIGVNGSDTLDGGVCRVCDKEIKKKTSTICLECYRKRPAKKYYCDICNKSISRQRTYCIDCYNNIQREEARYNDDVLDNTARQRKDCQELKKYYCESCGITGIRLENHHIDKNPCNNNPDNIKTLCCQCHREIHIKNDYKDNPYKNRFMMFDEIIEINYIGKEQVYDLEMKAPNHNFIANGFISHNSGPVSFMHVFDTATEQVKQGGTRRGANMGMLRVDHPDILEFMDCKKVDGVLSNFNISVAVTDDFMKALCDAEDYNLIDPISKKIVGSLNTQMVWDRLVTSAWDKGDPGIVFIDTINKHNPTPDVGDLEATNPCVTGDTLVGTPLGWKRVDSLEVNDFICTTLGSGLIKTIEVNENTPIFEVEFSDGGTQKVTAAHKYYVKRGDSKFTQQLRLDELEVGDNVMVHPIKCDFNRMDKVIVSDTYSDMDQNMLGFYIGIMIGDGCYTTSKNKLAKLSIDKNDHMWLKYLEHTFKSFGYRLDEQRTAYSMDFRSKGSTLIDELGIKRVKSPEKDIPLELINSNELFLKGLIDGLFSTDGDINASSNHPQVRYTTSSIDLAKSIRRILLMFGIHGRISTCNRKDKMVIEGREVNVNNKYTINISGSGIRTFYNEFKLSNKVKHYKLVEIVRTSLLTGNTWTAKIKSIEPCGEETVYDLYEESTDNWITDGYVQQGCGEQPLLPFEACNLGSINLAKFVMDDKNVDYDELEKVTRIAVRFLDDVIDAGTYPLPQIDEMVKSNRKIGLGVMGFADMLYKLDIPYDSEEALNIARSVMGFIGDIANEESYMIAEEKGSFPNVSKSIYENLMRNATVTTIAPTGTLSILADCSSGIEPVFALSFVKNVMGDEKLLESNPIFVEVAKERGFYTPEIMEKIAEHGSCVGVEGVPEDIQRVFVTAHDIAPEWHIKMQSAFQDYTDNAVSKTVNLPNDATTEDVDNIYRMAYTTNCKGVTIYRDGSKMNQVLTTNSTVRDQMDDFLDVFEKHTDNDIVFDSVKLPDEYPSTGYILKSEGKKWYLSVNFKDRNLTKPFAIFVNTNNREDSVPTFNSLDVLSELAIDNGLNIEMLEIVKKKLLYQSNPVKICRMLGFLFRHNVSINKIITSLESVEEATIGTFVHRITKFLYKFSDNTKENMVCPECGQNTLTFQEGCKLCVNCSYSACG